MARISRKQENHIQSVEAESWKIGLYVRLSIDDNGRAGRDSIDNQLGFIGAFAKKIKHSKVVRSYIDNGQTGTDFDRPEWEQLITDVKISKINCILVKDLSRFARNYIEAGDYLEKIFPILNVRFIAINDCYDSSNLLYPENDLCTSIKNVVNDYYAKDISRKVLSSFRTKKENGEFIGSQAPYGYILKDNHFVVDPEAASIVKKIFELKLRGDSSYAIAKMFNEEQIFSPSNYACERGIRKYRNSKTVLWSHEAINRVLYNEVYIGSLVQGKTNKSIYAREKIGLRSEKNWCITPNAHEAIIDCASFEKVQEIRRKNQIVYQRRQQSSKDNVRVNILKGFIYCGVCGRPLRRNSTSRKGKAEYAYYCNTRYNHADAQCTTASIVEHKIHDAIFKQIKLQIELAVEVDSLLSKTKASVLKSARYQNLCETANQNNAELKRVLALKNVIYEDYKGGILTREEYMFAKQRYTSQVSELKQQVEQDEKIRKYYEDNLTNQNTWVKQFKKFEAERELTKFMVTELLEKVEIFPDRRIQIIFKFSEEYHSVIDCIEGNLGERMGKTDDEIFSRIP